MNRQVKSSLEANVYQATVQSKVQNSIFGQKFERRESMICNERLNKFFESQIYREQRIGINDVVCSKLLNSTYDTVLQRNIW